MLELLRSLAEVGAAANWIVRFAAMIAAVFTSYIGIAMWATLRAHDADQREIRYEMFRDLLSAFVRGWRR